MQKQSVNEFDTALATAIPRLKPYAIKLTGNSTLADDLIQDTAERALNARTLFTEGSNIFGWLSVIMRNQYFNYLRKEKVRTVESLDEWADKIMAPDDLEEFMLLRDVETAMADLRPHHLRAILAAAIGIEYEELAKIEGIPLGTVKSRTNRAREHLCEALA